MKSFLVLVTVAMAAVSIEAAPRSCAPQKDKPDLYDPEFVAHIKLETDDTDKYIALTVSNEWESYDLPTPDGVTHGKGVIGTYCGAIYASLLRRSLNDVDWTLERMVFQNGQPEDIECVLTPDGTGYYGEKLYSCAANVTVGDLQVQKRVATLVVKKLAFINRE